MELSIQTTKSFDLTPTNFEQALTLADYLANSDMVPKDFKGKPGNCLIAMQWGLEVGLKPLQALQNIAVINGRPSMWGDALIALVRSSPLCEYVNEEMDGHGTAICRAKRRGEAEQIRTFSDIDAKVAGLAGKQGPWMTSPKRMKQLRARAFALRDVFPDVLKGMNMAEEVMDIPQEAKRMGEAVQVAPAIDVQELVDRARQTTTDADALAFWKQNNALLAKDRNAFDAFKSAVAEHRKSLAQPVINNAPMTAASTGEVTISFDQLIAKLDKATSEDGLYIAMDWSASMDDQSRLMEAEEHFNLRLSQIQGA